MREGDVAKGVAIGSKIGQVRFEEAAVDLVTDYRVNKKRTLVDLIRRVETILGEWFRGRRLATIGTADVRAYAHGPSFGRVSFRGGGCHSVHYEADQMIRRLLK
jgi:hypothetical protein